MKKYTIYRLPVDKSQPRSDTELVAVEFGADIVEVTPKLIKAVTTELSAMPEYRGCDTSAYEPEEINKGRKYQYKMQGVVYPPNAANNILVDFVIKEKNMRTDECLPELETAK
jgi:hypothetical protein